MKITWTVCLILSGGVLLSQAQTADDYVNQGRALLAATNLSDANLSFSNAVALAPNNEPANVFYAATRLLVLPCAPAGSNFLNRLGLPEPGRNVYHWTAQWPADTNGIALAPTGVSVSDATALFRTNVLSAILGAEANLARVTDTNFLLHLTADETRLTAVTLDYGDVQMMRAMLQAAEYCVYTIHSWNLDVQFSALRSLLTSGQLTVGRLLEDYPSLLTFATTNDLRAAESVFTNGVSCYLAASEFIRNRPTNVVRLFNYDAGKAEEEQHFRQTLVDFRDSLAGTIPLTLDTNYTMFLAAHFAGEHSVRSFLPAFRGNGFVLGTLPDPTFGGLVYGIERGQAEGVLSDQFHLLPIPSLDSQFSQVQTQFEFPINTLRGRGYVVQVSTNLVNWQDNDAFFAFGSQTVFTDTEARLFPNRYYRVVDRTHTMPPPPNDDFADAIPLTGLGIRVFGYNANATVEPDEPGLGFLYNLRATIWWKWTASLSGPVEVDTTGSLAYPSVAVYDASHNEVAYGNQPFDAAAGATYYLQVWGGWPAPSGIELEITSP